MVPPAGLTYRQDITGPSKTIHQVGDKWVLYTKDGTKVLGEFTSYGAAVKREQQINYFKTLKTFFKLP